MHSRTLLFALAACNGSGQRSYLPGDPSPGDHSKTADRSQLIQTGFKSPQGDHATEGRVTIHRQVDEVFRFYRDFRNLPRFLGDVMDVEQLGPSTSRWTIRGPLGIQAHWTIRLIEERPNEFIRYETITTTGLGTRWEIIFDAGPEANETEVREVMNAPLGRLGRLALALIGNFPAEEVSANLHRLKEIMETGRVTDTSYSVAGKFGHR